MKGKIAVTPRSLSRSGHPALDELRKAGYEVIFPTPGKQPSFEELRSFLPGCVGYLAGVEPIPGDILKLCPDLRVISRNGVGVDNIDLGAAEQMQIVVKKAAGANSRGVAELTITLMMAGLRHTTWSNNQLKKGDWARKKGIEINRRVLGIVGCGQIGKYVAEMAIGLGMRVLAYDPYPDDTFRPDGNFGYSSFDQLIRKSDVISLHCPPSGKPIIDATVIHQMKRGVYIVNTARAGLIDVGQSHVEKARSW